MEELDLKGLLEVFWEKKFLIIIIMLVFILVGILYSYLYVKPVYESYTTLLLVKLEDSNTSDNAITQTDITINQKLVYTYSELVKSKSVLKEVINNLGLDRSYESLKNNISATFAKNTELIKITVRDENPEMARDICENAADVFTKLVGEAYKINNVTIIDEAEANYTPSNINHTKDILLFAMIGLVFAALTVLVLSLLNTTIRQASDIEKSAKLLVLAEIPKYTFEERGGRD